MIARIWHGVTPGSKGNAYVEYLRESGIKAYESTDGCRGVFVLRRDLEGKSDFVLISLWDSYTAIERFAGPEYERAVYYPHDKEFLIEFEPNVSHYDVVQMPQTATGKATRRAATRTDITKAARSSRSRVASRHGRSSRRR
jgi:heme-degrading monooxygenase HmoA